MLRYVCGDVTVNMAAQNDGGVSDAQGNYFVRSDIRANLSTAKSIVCDQGISPTVDGSNGDNNRNINSALSDTVVIEAMRKLLQVGGTFLLVMHLVSIFIASDLRNFKVLLLRVFLNE